MMMGSIIDILHNSDPMVISINEVQEKMSARSNNKRHNFLPVVQASLS
jgi:hypothetical protein